MNDRLLEILAARPDFPVAAEDRGLLESFCEYLDRSSLFLAGYERNGSGQPVFIFTNEAERYRFSMEGIRRLVNGMKQGSPIDWELLRAGN